MHPVPHIPSTNLLESLASAHPSAISTVLAAENNDHHHNNNTINADSNNRDNTNGVIVVDATNHTRLSTNGNDVSTISFNRNDNNYNHLPVWPKPPTEMTVVKLSYINLS